MIRNGGWLSISCEGISKLFFSPTPTFFSKNEVKKEDIKGIKKKTENKDITDTH